MLRHKQDQPRVREGVGSERLQFADVQSSERRVSKTVKEGGRETWGLAKEPSYQ